MRLLGALEQGAFAVRGAISWPFRMLGRIGVFLPALALVWAIALACYGFVWVVDPYELRSTRPSEHLADHPYPGDIVPQLTSVAVNGGADVVILGASTAMGYTPSMMRAAFPEARRPVNLAYSCADEHDLGLILPRLELSPSLKRVIVSLDATLISTCGTSHSPLDQRYYVASWHDPVPEFSLEAVGLARRVANGGELDQPAWRPDTSAAAWPPMTAQPELMAKARRYVALARGRAAAGAPFPCERVTVLRVLTPFIRREAARGVIVDILSPPYSLALYSDWTASLNPFPGPPFVTAMALRRCVLLATAGVPNVYFHAFDADPLTANLSLYRDLGHIRDDSVYQAILNHIAARDHLLTPQQWPAFESRLKRDVDAFQP
jgi:hypothetical protein